MIGMHESRYGSGSKASRFFQSGLACLCLLVAGGWAAADPVATVTPTDYDFGSVEITTTQEFATTFTVENTGDADLEFGALSVTGVDASLFTILNDNCSNTTLAPTATATVDVRFAPDSTGAKAANLSIPSNVPTVDVPLAGTGIFTGVVSVDDPGRIYHAYSNLDGTFGGFRDIGVDIGGNARAIGLADFDNDGDMDFIAGAGNNTSNASYHYFENNGDATFTSHGVVFTVREATTWAMDVATGDFDGDGNADVIANGNAIGISLFRGNGDGTFTFAAGIYAEGHSRGTDAADFNHDGKLDFARANYSSGYIHLYLGDGAGRFTRSYVGDVGNDPYGLAAGDFDNDGHPDIMAISGADGLAYFFRGKGEGTFEPATRVPSLDTGLHGGYDAFDFDRDGNLDIVLVNHTRREMWYYPGNGGGGFGAPTQVNTVGMNTVLAISAPLATAGYGAPTAVASPVDTIIALGGTVNFDGSASSDPGGAIVSYDWDFGDGATDTGAAPSHTYTAEAVRHGMLKVTDDSGKIDYAAFTVTVQGGPPTAEAGGPYSFGELYLSDGEWTATFDGTGSSDAETAISYEWDFGDSYGDDFEDGDDTGWGKEEGTWAEADGVYTQSNASPTRARNLLLTGNKLEDFTMAVDVEMTGGSGKEVQLLFRAKNIGNNYELIFRGRGYDDALIYRWIADAGTQIAQRQLPFAIVDNQVYHLEVVCQGGSIKAYVDGILAVEVYDTFFPAGYAGLSTYRTSAKFDNLVVTSASGTGQNPTHIYRKGPGVYTATLTVTDAAGQTHSDTAQVNLVYNDPPQADAGGPYGATEQQAWAGRWPVQLDGSLSTDDVEIVDYSWTIESDDFSGTTIHDRWLAAGATQNDEVAITGGGWGSRYLFNKHRVTRGQAGRVAVEGKVKVPSGGSGEVMFGFKNTGTNYSYTQMPYAIHFYVGNGYIKVYEDGTDRGSTGYNFSADTWYDVRVELKNPAGARYYFRPSGSPDWILAYDSNYSTINEFLTGFATSRGVVINDYKLTLHGTTPVAYYYEPGVYPVELTVADRAGQTDSASATATITQGDPPIADAGPDIDLDEGDVFGGTWYVLLNGSASFDDFGIYRYEWDFGDGETGSGVFVGHTYTQPNAYIVTLTVYDHALQSSSDTMVVMITPGDPPVADAGPDLNLGELDALNGTWPVRFDGSGSTDDFGIMQYDWDFGDGEIGFGKITSHAYTAVGIYTATLTVIDHASQPSSDTMIVTITAGAPPSADAGGPYVAQEPDVADGTAFLLFDGSASTDDAPMLHYLWDFGTETFDGVYLDKKMWDYSYEVYPGVYGDYVTIWGANYWGNRYLFTSHTVDKRPGLIAEASLNESGNTMFGFKHGNNTTYSYTDMPYAIYLNSGNLRIYEDGADRGDTGYDYTQNTWYDYKVVINHAGGAYYYYKRSDVADWTLIYKSTYVSGGQLKPGFVVNNSSCHIDNFRMMATGKTVTFPVRHEGEVTLTVEDQAHQLDSQTVPIDVVGSNGPTADPNGPYISTFELPITFDGSGSVDDNGVTKYVWDYGDGTPLGSGPNPVHAYAVADNTAPTTKAVTLTVYDAAGQTDTKTTTVTLATGPLVVGVPWQFSGGAEVPHHTWSGKSVRLKGTVKGGIGALTYTWDFGDGEPVATGTVTNKYAIEASHAYTGSEGALFTATLTVEDSQGNSHTDTYPVEILPNALDTRIDVAIDEGLWWLHKNQYRDTTSYYHGRWSSYSNYYGSPTGSALQAFLINGHRETGDDRQDPYVETVRTGMQFLFKQLGEQTVSVQTYGDPDYPYNGTGNKLGLAARWSNRMPYEGGMIMDGIVATATPNRVAWTGNVNVAGRTYKEILQDMIDCYAWGQSDDPNSGGGWRYSWHQWPDNSACQWAAIGMIPAAKIPWYCIIPEWVRNRNNVWLNYSYNSGSKWFGYTGTGAGNYSSHACRPSGMVQMVMSVDNYKSDSRWLGTEGWFATTGNWNWFIGNRSQYGWYAFVKAMRLSKTEVLSNGFNWYRASTGIAEKLVGELESDGSWPSGGQVTHPGDYGNTFVTAWAVVMLTPSLFELPPVAEAGPDVVWAYDLPLTFDGSRSYHLDPNRELVLYEWDFDGDGAYDYAGTNPVATHTYPFSGDSADYPMTYTAVLRITDNMGAGDTATRQVIIAEPPHAPFAVITGPMMIGGTGVATAGMAVPFDGTGSYDIDPTDTISRYEWDFDGSDGYDFDNPQSTDAVTSNTYAAPGVYNIGLRVWDNGVLNLPDNDPLPSLPAYLRLNVEPNFSPVADAGGPYVVDEGAPLMLSGSGSDPNLALDPLTFAWDLDEDGDFDDATDLTPTYTWPQQGEYTVVLRVSDGLGLSDTSSATVTVNDTGPTAEFSWDPASPNEGSPVQFNDQSAPAIDPIATWQWDFAGLGASTDQNPSFTFMDDGVYSVTLTVTDADGSSDTISHDINVAAVGPTAVDDTIEVERINCPIPIDALVGDTYLPGPPETLTIIATTDGAHGTVAITGGGTGLTYHPTSADYLGPDTFTYTIADEDGLTDTANVNVTIVAPALPGDVTGDCLINILDLLFVRNCLQQDIGTNENCCKADLNFDGSVNVLDLLFVRNRLQTRCN